MNTSQICLELTETSLRAFSIGQAHIALQTQWPLDSATMSALSDFARQYRAAIFHLLVETPDEEFRRERLPRLKGSDRRALIAHRLQQTFTTNDYRHARMASTQGSQEFLLFCALGKQEWITPIVDTLQQQKCMLAGIYSTTLALADLVLPHSRQLPATLLTMYLPTGLLYQCLCTPFGLQYARKIHLPINDENYSDAITRETLQLSQYLANLHLLNQETVLGITLLSDQDTHTSMASACLPKLEKQVPNSRCTAISNKELAAQLKLSTQTSWQTLLMVAIKQGRISNHYAPPAATLLYRQRRLGHIVKMSSLLIILFTAIFAWQAGHQMLQQQTMLNASQDALAHATQEQKKWVASQEKPSGLSAQKQAAIQLYREYLYDWPDVEQTAQSISQCWYGLSSLTLKHFLWQTQTSSEFLANKTDVAMSPTQLAHANARWQIIDLDGIADLRDYRTALSQLTQLQNRFAALPRSQVTLRKPLIDLGTQSQLSSQIFASASAPFSLRIAIAPTQGQHP